MPTFVVAGDLHYTGSIGKWRYSISIHMLERDVIESNEDQLLINHDHIKPAPVTMFKFISNIITMHVFINSDSCRRPDRHMYIITEFIQFFFKSP